MKYVVIIILSIQSLFGQKNKIFKENKTLTFYTIYTDSLKQLTITDTVKFIPTHLPWKHQPNKQNTVVWKCGNLKVNDSIRNTLFSIGWFDTDSTGFIDNEELFWTHPIRSKHYTIAEIAPFPLIEFPIVTYKKFRRTLKIGSGWGPWSNMSLLSSYEITGKTVKRINNVIYPCWVITSESESSLGKSYLTTTFSEQFGFVEYVYTFYNKVNLTMKLLKVE
jgi:hypothetical protein